MRKTYGKGIYMNIIYWTTATTDDNQVAVMALNPVNDVCLNYTIDEDRSFKVFPTVEEAEFHVKEILKPMYYRNHRASYELVYVDAESDIWCEVFTKWEEYYNKIVFKVKYDRAPLWKKIFMLLFKKV